MIRFGFTSKSPVYFNFQSILLKPSNTKLARLVKPYSCLLSQQFNEATPINSTNSLCLPSSGPSFIHLNSVLTSNRVFHTMNVSQNQNKVQPPSSNNNQSSSSDDNLNHNNADSNAQPEATNNQVIDPKDKKGRFKALIRDYGLTAVVFHVTISLASLGICYLLVNSSIPMEKVFTWLGINEKLGNLSDAASTSTNFVVAYAVHKSMALIRLSITAACVPVIVRYLRSKGILKPVAKVVKRVD